MRLLAGAIAACGIPVCPGWFIWFATAPNEAHRRTIAGHGRSHSSQPRIYSSTPTCCSPPWTALESYQLHLPIASAQVKSCLLLAALGADGTTVLREPGPSRDHTENMLRSMGVSLVKDSPANVRDPGVIYYQTRISPTFPCAYPH